MLINSKFHDYYDSAQNTGVDKKIVYDRYTKQLEGKDRPQLFDSAEHSWIRGEHLPTFNPKILKKKGYQIVDIVGYAIGFCGKIYLGYEFSFDYTDHEYLYDYKDIKKMLIKLKYKKSSYKDDLDVLLKEMFDKYHDKEYSLDIFRKYNTPVFYETFRAYPYATYFRINPSLKDIGFYKVKDTYTAYQEIFQFISGVLGTNENDTVELTDKEQVLKKGFDPKWSFRKDVDTRKRKKK